MYSFDLNSFIALLLIDKVEAFRNSYELTKVLAWKFDIITIVDIVQNLKDNNLIVSKSDKGIDKYEITNKGVDYINLNMDVGKISIQEKYIEDISFINALFSTPSSSSM